jgi:hypothetical protein
LNGSVTCAGNGRKPRGGCACAGTQKINNAARHINATKGPLKALKPKDDTPARRVVMMVTISLLLSRCSLWFFPFFLAFRELPPMARTKE